MTWFNKGLDKVKNVRAHCVQSFIVFSHLLVHTSNWVTCVQQIHNHVHFKVFTLECCQPSSCCFKIVAVVMTTKCLYGRGREIGSHWSKPQAWAHLVASCASKDRHLYAGLAKPYRISVDVACWVASMPVRFEAATAQLHCIAFLNQHALMHLPICF